jgi:hypothetical protein
MNHASGHARFRPASTRARARAVILSVTLLATGTALGSFATSLVERQAAAAEPAPPAVDARGGGLTEEAARAIIDRLRGKLDLSDAQADAVGASIRSRLDTISGIKSELARRIAAEHELLDRDLRRTLTDAQFSAWKQVLDEVRANRRRRIGARTDREG